MVNKICNAPYDVVETVCRRDQRRKLLPIRIRQLERNDLGLIQRQQRSLELTLERRAVFSYVNGGGEGAKAAPPCISGTDWIFSMRFSPIGRELQAHYFRCLRYQKMSNHVLQNQNDDRQPRCKFDVVIRTWYNQLYGSNPNFWSQATRWRIFEYSPMSEWLVNQRWPPLTGST